MYIYVLDALYQHSLYLYYNNQRHIRPFTVLHATKIFSCRQQGLTYTFFINFANGQRRIHTSSYSQVTFYRCLVIGCTFLWLLNYIYKSLDTIEIMPNCNTNSQGRIYTSILQGFSKALVAEVYIEFNATNKRVCMP